jgi:mRNA interferase RelE/StbE
LGWTIEIDPQAQRVLRKLGRPMAARILSYLEELGKRDDPRTGGEGLTGPLAGYWRYRVGDYRLICELHDEQLILIVLEIGHRSDIYR